MTPGTHATTTETTPVIDEHTRISKRVLWDMNGTICEQEWLVVPAGEWAARPESRSPEWVAWRIEPIGLVSAIRCPQA